MTLFEGDYHKGVAALANSLYDHGFRGHIYAGYRGNLPPWVSDSHSEEGYVEHPVAEGCSIRFVKVESPWHLTNFKPQFMLDVWERFEKEAQSLFYFDPDIVVKCSWDHFEQWAGYGIALCQDVVTQSMSENHPIRGAWREWASKHGWEEKSPQARYYNGGFVGVIKSRIHFVELWRDMMDRLGSERDLSRFMTGARPDPFHGSDQDVLNICAMCAGEDLSTIGPEGMDFVGGGYTMSHAVGSPKPWRRRHAREFFRGNPPTLADKAFWSNVEAPIQIYSRSQTKRARFSLRLSSFFSRFYRKG